MIKTLCLLIVLGNFAFSQEKMELTYKVMSAGFSDDLGDSNKELIKDYIIQMEKELEDLTYKLQIDKSESIWFLEDRNSFSNAHMGKALGGTFTYYLNNENDEYIVQQDFLKELFIVKEKKSNFNWELIDETKMILGYECKKAISKSSSTINGIEKTFITEAWYCPKLKHKIGPQNFGGLNGLILEITDKKRKYYCTEIAVAGKMRMFVVQRPIIGKPIESEDFGKEMERISKENGIPYMKN